jgi:hypothetical protein
MAYIGSSYNLTSPSSTPSIAIQLYDNNAVYNTGDTVTWTDTRTNITNVYRMIGSASGSGYNPTTFPTMWQNLSPQSNTPSSNTQSSNTLPSNTQPSATQQSNTLPSNTQSSNTLPSNTQSSNTLPSNTQSSIPSVTQPVVAPVLSSNTQSRNTPSSQRISNTQNTVLNSLNSLTTFNTPSGAAKLNLNALSSLTINQPVSTVVNLPILVSTVFTSNSTTYPNLVNSQLAVTMATTTTNPITGNESLDINQLQTNTIVVVPSLVEGATVEISGYNIQRGNISSANTTVSKGLTNQISIDGKTWLSIGSPIIIGNKILILSGIGSPVVFTVTSYLSNSATPSSPIDYIFMLAYPAAFLGAIFFSINTFFNIKPLSSVANSQVEMAINGYIAVSGFLSLLLWLQPCNLGIISTLLSGITVILQPIYNINTIKISSSS